LALSHPGPSGDDTILRNVIVAALSGLTEDSLTARMEARSNFPFWHCNRCIRRTKLKLDILQKTGGLVTRGGHARVNAGAGSSQAI